VETTARGGALAAGEPRPPISPLEKRIDWLAGVCELNRSQRFLLGLLTQIARFPQVRNLVGAINRQDYDTEKFDFDDLRPLLDAQVDRREAPDTKFDVLG
jgi:hypothetical protein